MTRIPILVLSLFVFAHTPVDGAVRKSVRLSVRTSPVVVERGGSFTAVFADEPMLATVALNFVAVPDGMSGSKQAPEVWRLPSRAWWTSLEWTLHDISKQRVAVAPKVIREGIANAPKHTESTGPFDLHLNQRPSADFNLGILPVGDYMLSVRFEQLRSEQIRFSVRKGDESPDVRRSYLRAQLRRPGTFADASRILSELSRLEPDNASLHEQLAELSLDQVPLDETLKHYDRAVEVLQRRARAAARQKGASAELSDAFNREFSRIASVKAALQAYGADRKTLRAVFVSDGGRSVLQLVRRDNGKVVRTAR